MKREEESLGGRRTRGRRMTIDEEGLGFLIVWEGGKLHNFLLKSPKITSQILAYSSTLKTLHVQIRNSKTSKANHTLTIPLIDTTISKLGSTLSLTQKINKIILRVLQSPQI